MNFTEAISTCFRKYGDFSGRAARSEYWWWELFLVLGTLAAALFGDKVSALFSLATLLPSLAVGARRLHDVDKSGWWQLLWIVPIIGWLILLYWTLQPGREPNRFN